MFDREIDSILRDRNPSGWSPDEARRIKELFCQMRPIVPALLVKQLWQYWYATDHEQLLFEDPEDNIALLLHARAYGEHVPSLDDESFLGKFLKAHKQLFAPPTSSQEEGVDGIQQGYDYFSPLKWGPRAILSQNALAGLTSPILHVWVFIKDSAVQQILIVGQGLPEIRQQVLANAFITSLRVHAVANDIMNIGLLRIELPGYAQTAEDIPLNILGDNPTVLSPDAKATALEAMQEFHGFLLGLSQKTSLVQIHEAKTADQLALTNVFKTYARRAAVEGIVLVARKSRQQGKEEKGTIAGDKSNQQKKGDLVTLVPSWHIARSPLTLALTLSSDLLKTESYGRLLKAYQAATFKRVMMDISIRREHYRREAEGLEADKKSFDEASPQERDEIWGKTVLLVHEFKFEFGITIKLAHPKETATETYYKVGLPVLIKHYRDWEKRMEKILNSLLKSKERPDAPISRFAASRFLDAALRNQHPDESGEALAAFEVWQSQVQPLLYFEWRNCLRQFNIKESDIFTHHTIFHSTFSLTEDGQDTDEIMISPYSLLDQHRSVGLFDPELGVSVVRSEADYARPFTPASKPVEEYWDELVALAKQADSDTATRPEIKQQVFADALREALRQAPAEMMQRILAQMFESRQMGEPQDSKKTSAEPDKEMLTTLVMAVDKTAVTRGINHALLARSVLALQSARNALALLSGHAEWAARIWLVRALIECEAIRQPFHKILPAIFHRTEWSAYSEIQEALEQARDADREFVEKWIEALETNPVRAIGRLVRGLPQAELVCTPKEYAALLARGAIESARLAREIEQAAASLGEERELITTAFAKVGWALEEALLADFVGGLEGDLIELVKDLTAEEPLKYPDTGEAW